MDRRGDRRGYLTQTADHLDGLDPHTAVLQQDQVQVLGTLLAADAAHTQVVVLGPAVLDVNELFGAGSVVLGLVPVSERS
jgi:hypothetical protein